MSSDVLMQLVAMSRNLGDPDRDYVILGEGNTSARADAGTFQYEGKRSDSFQYEGKRSDSFWVKASGVELRTAGAGDFADPV